MSISRVFALGLGLALAAAACSDDEQAGGTGGKGGSAAGSGGKGGSGASGGSGGSGASGGSGTGGAAGADSGGDAGLVTFSGIVVLAAPGTFGTEAPLEGVEVCVVDSSGVKNPSIPCVTTNAAGEYAVSDLTPNQDLILMFTKTAYGTQLVAADIGTADIQRVGLRLALELTDGGPDGGSVTFGWDPTLTIDPTKGNMATFAVQASASPDAGAAAPGLDFTDGVSFLLSPAGGDGPYYVNPDETWAASATATVNGYGAWFMNLDAGTYTLTATHPTLSCNPAAGNGYGWAQTDGSTKAPVIAGTSTQGIGFFCAPPATDAGTD